MLRILLGLALLLAAPAFAQTVRWEMPTEYPATSMPGAGLSSFAQAIATTSGGRIEIVPSFETPGLKSADTAAAVAGGRFPAADAFAGGLGGTDPIFLATSLPFVTLTVDDAWRFYQAAKPAYERALAKSNLRLLYATPWPPTGLWSKAPVARPSDLQGLAVRSYDATGTAVLKAAGAAPVELSFGATMPKLKDGSVVAVLSSGDGGAGRRLWEYLPHFTAIAYAQPVSLAFAGNAALDALAPDLRAAVLSAAAETERRQWLLVRDRLQQNYAQMQANGVRLLAEPPAELRATLTRAAETAVADWLRQTGADGEAILRRYRGG